MASRMIGLLSLHVHLRGTGDDRKTHGVHALHMPGRRSSDEQRRHEAPFSAVAGPPMRSPGTFAPPPRTARTTDLSRGGPGGPDAAGRRRGPGGPPGRAHGRVWPTGDIRPRSRTGRGQARRPAHPDLRHSFGSWFGMRGGSLQTLQTILGRADIKMTLRYARLAPDHLRTEMSRTERSTHPSPIAQASAQEPVAERESLQKLEPAAGLEPATCRLRNEGR